jgi:hypothetical protein
VDARSVDKVAAQIERKKRRMVEQCAVAVAAAALAAFMGGRLGWVDAAAALGAGAALEFMLALDAHFFRHALIERSALEPAAYAIREVRQFGLQLVHPSCREALAGRLRGALAEAQKPGSVWLQDRVETYAGELKALAFDLTSPTAEVKPTSAALCYLLVTSAADSPLCNPNLPAEDVASALHRIRVGIRTGAASAA